MVRVDLENHSVLKLGTRDRVLPVLREEATVELRREPEKKARSRVSSDTRGASSASGPEDRALFDALRDKRMAIAREQGVPAYIVFNDRTLIEMAARRPGNEMEFSEIAGVGASKLERYGRIFLEVIARHTQEPNAVERVAVVERPISLDRQPGRDLD